MFHDLLGDLRYAARVLLREKGFALAVVLTLATSIGATVAVFTLADAIVLRPLRFPNADRLVVVEHSVPGLDVGHVANSDGSFLVYRSQAHVFDDMGAYYENVATLTGGSDAERVHVAMATSSLFSTLGARPYLGRLFNTSDGLDARDVPVLISYSLWHDRFGADVTVVGRRIEVNGALRTVVGVLPKEFAFPRPETAIWYPATPDLARADLSDFHFNVIGRLKEGVDAAAAAADLERMVPVLAGTFGNGATAWLRESRWKPVVRPLKDVVIGDLGMRLWLLLGGMFFVLAIAGVNAASLALVRSEYRSKEMAIRSALGAAGPTLARMLFVEGTLLGILGGGMGLVMAVVGVRAFVAYGPPNLPRLAEVDVTLRAVALSVALVGLAGVLLGAIPTAGLQRRSASSRLAATSRRTEVGPREQVARKVLVGFQVALAQALLVGSLLMVRSFLQISSVDPGFRSHGVLTFDVPMPYSSYPEYGDAVRLWNALIAKIGALPGVEAVGAANALPLVPLPSDYNGGVTTPGREGTALPVPIAVTSFVTAGYFEAMGIPVEGMSFPKGGAEAMIGPVIVSRSLGRQLFPGEKILGQRLRRAESGDSTWLTVIGVAGDTPESDVTDRSWPVLYIPVLERQVDSGLVPRGMQVVVKTARAPLALVPEVRATIRSLDPQLPVADVRTMDEIVAASMARTRLTMVLLIVAAVSAMFLGAVGIYGSVAYVVSLRRREIGVRLALGARRVDVRYMVLRQIAVVIGVGLAIGIAAALALSRFLVSFLYGVSAMDPASILAAVLVFVGVAAAAVLVPVRRAVRLDPRMAMEAE